MFEIGQKVRVKPHQRTLNFCNNDITVIPGFIGEIS